MPSRKNLTVYEEPPMRYNIALQKYEPDFSSRVRQRAPKGDGKNEKTNDWAVWIFFIVFVLVILALILLAHS